MGPIDCYGLTDRGMAQLINEDKFLIADLRKSIFVHQTNVSWEDHTRMFGATQGYLLLVADGGSGRALGVEASSMVVKTIARYLLNMLPWLYRLDGQQTDDFVTDLAATLSRCQERIQVRADATGAEQVMGTTLTMAYIIWPRLYVVHVGHSRCYLLRQSRLEQITTDHTLAQQLVESGVVSPQEMADTRLSRILWNAIGGENDELSPEVYTAELQWGDTLMLCTDGLSRYVDDQEIRMQLQTKDPAEATCQKLVEAAKQASAPDNVTVVVARFHPDVHTSGIMVESTEQHEPVAVNPASSISDTAVVEPLAPPPAEPAAEVGGGR